MLAFFFYMIHTMWQATGLAPDERSALQRRNVLAMLASRVIVPLVFGFLPVITLTICVFLDVNQPVLYLALLSLAVSSGFFNSTATIAVYKPYRHGMMRVLRRALPENLRAKVYHSTSRIDYVGSKNGKPKQCAGQGCALLCYYASLLNPNQDSYW